MLPSQPADADPPTACNVPYEVPYDKVKRICWLISTCTTAESSFDLPETEMPFSACDTWETAPRFQHYYTASAMLRWGKASKFQHRWHLSLSLAPFWGSKTPHNPT